jgi:site-specific DNA-methyltransferase (adenine-specific)
MTKQVSFTLRRRNPDVLTCIANLSNDEVFTPPELAGRMLDMLAEAWAADNGGAILWADKTVRFLDPFTKSGVFLREITSRLTEGLAQQMPDLQARVNHILTQQVFGIGITHLTSLLARRSVYCSKYANGLHSIAKAFDNDSGNIWFERTEHTWTNGKCTFCGASQAAMDRGEALETHAYAFIHTESIKTRMNELFGGNMQFDVIIGNPPYQLDDGGYGMSAAPIYQKFVEQAKQLEPRYLTMVIPARWYAGGKGLDEFRARMLNDTRIRKLIDFENSSELFPGVDVAGGICYFLWDRDNPGLCEVVNVQGDQTIAASRLLSEFPTLIRHSRAVPIVRKVLAVKENNGKALSSVVSSRKPFGLPTNYAPQTEGLPCWFTQKLGLRFASKSDASDSGGLLGKWKLLIPPAPIAGQTDFSKPVGFYYLGNTRIAKPGECCTESWLVACAFNTKEEVTSFRSYLFTKIVRFLLLQTVVSQHVTKEKFVFVPYLSEYKGEFTDDLLRKRWGIDDEEWKFIDSKIKAIELVDE